MGDTAVTPIPKSLFQILFSIFWARRLSIPKIFPEFLFPENEFFILAASPQERERGARVGRVPFDGYSEK
jgi:hypothetical protein